MSASRGVSAVLEVRGLCVRDGAGRALVSGVDLAVAPGEVLGVVGESGSGKTITVRACLGLLPAGLTSSCERLVVAGADALAMGEREHARLLGEGVGFVPQNTAEYLHPLMRIRDQVTDGYRAWHHATRRAALGRVRELLESVGITEPDRVLAAYPGQLSGGMRQRVNIAMALMGDPSLVVADEPTASIDCILARQVVESLARVARERGVAVVLVSHGLGMVRSCCDRVAVMYAGHVVESGPCAQVFRLDGHPYTRALAQALPRRAGGASEGSGAPARLASIPGTMPEDGRDTNACLFAPRCPRRDAGVCAGPQRPWCEGERTVLCSLLAEERGLRDGC